MFIKKSFMDEIVAGMEKKLISNAAEISQLEAPEEEKKEIAKTASALDHLVKAAELFEDVGFEKEAEVLTTFLEVIAKKKKKKRGRPTGSKSKKSTSKSTKDFTKFKKDTAESTKNSDKSTADTQSADCGDMPGLGRVGPTQMAEDAHDEEPSEEQLDHEFDEIMKELESEESEPMKMSSPEEKLERDFEEE